MADEGLTHTPPGITGCCAAARAIRAGIRVPSESAQSRAAATLGSAPRRAYARARVVRTEPSEGTHGKTPCPDRRHHATCGQHLAPKPATGRGARSPFRTGVAELGGGVPARLSTRAQSAWEPWRQAPREGRGVMRDTAACAGEQRCQAGSPISMGHELAQKAIRRPSCRSG